MTVKIIIFAVVILTSLICEPVLCGVGDDCTAGQNEACGKTEICTANACAARVTCDVTAHCNDQGTCASDQSCTCNQGFTGNDCSKTCPMCEHNGKCMMKNGNPACDCTGTGYEGATCQTGACGGAACTTDQVCVGPAVGKVCFADPCKTTPCGANGDCSYNGTLAAPTFVCTCKNGYGGTTCTETPDCTKSEDCTDPDKPECKMVAGEKSVCAAKENGGNIVAVAPGLLLSLLLAVIYL